MTLSPTWRKDIFNSLFQDKWIWLVTGATILWNAAIFFDWSPYLLGPSNSPIEWRWSHIWPPNIVFARLVLPLGVAGLLCVWAIWTRSLQRVRVWQLLILAGLALTFRLAVQSVNVNGLSIVARVLNPSYFGYFPPATRVDALGPFLHTYAETQSQLGYRIGTHPPGNIALYWLIIKAVNMTPLLSRIAGPFLLPRMAEAPSWMAAYTVSNVIAGAIAAILVPLCSCLSLIPLYYVAHQLAGPASAHLVVLLLALLPASTVFIPVIDDFYTLLAVLATWLTINGLVKQKSWYLLAAGFTVGIALFQSFSTIPLVVLIELFIILHHFSQSPRAWRLALNNVLAFAVGTTLLWALIWLIFGLNPFKVYLNSLGDYDARLRSYWSWVIYDPYDILLFAGVPVAIHFVSSIIRLGRSLVARRPSSMLDCLLAATILTLSLLFLSGNLRGETARILLYVFPFVALFAAEHIISSAKPAYYSALLLTLTGLQTLIFQISLATYH